MRAYYTRATNNQKWILQAISISKKHFNQLSYYMIASYPDFQHGYTKIDLMDAPQTLKQNSPINILDKRITNNAI